MLMWHWFSPGSNWSPMQTSRPVRKMALAVLVGVPLLLCIAGPFVYERLRSRRAVPTAPSSPTALPTPPRPRTGPVLIPTDAASIPTVHASRPMPPQFTAAGSASHGEKEEFPLWNLSTPPPGQKLALPVGTHVISLDLEGDGRRLAFVSQQAAAPGRLFVWDFAGPPTALALPSEAAQAKIREVLFSRFNQNLYLILEQGSEWRIVATHLERGGLAPMRTLYRSPSELRNLRTASVLYSGQERLFFARAYAPERFQILSVRQSGEAVYELTSPTGAAGVLTDAKLRSSKPPPDTEAGNLPSTTPNVERAVSALPLSIHHVGGRLLWQDEQGLLHERAYSGANWSDSEPKKGVPAGTDITDTANGYFLVQLIPGRRGVELVHSAGSVEKTVGPEYAFRKLPVVASNGRSLVGVIGDGPAQPEQLVVLGISAPLAPVRYAHSLHNGAQLTELAKHGMQLLSTNHEQLYNTYESFEYTSCHDEILVPVFASIDGFLEILAAGFQAAFMATEQNMSRPRLERFLTELQAVAKREQLTRVEKIAAVSAQILKGNYDSEEGKLVKAERSAESTLHGDNGPVLIDFSDFHPRGPYTATSELEHYFRAFKYVNQLRLSAAEQGKLVKDARLTEAWRTWVDTQKPFLGGSRHPLFFAPERKPPAHVREECNAAATPLLFPLAWGIDSEIWDRVVMHTNVPQSCGVDSRALPNGIDLLTALGSPAAQTQAQSEYAQFPALKTAHEALKARFARPLLSSLTPEAWLHLVQLLGSDEYVPEGVSKTMWQGRLMQTALASWTNFRHTTVLVNELNAAECGGPDFDVFEPLSAEPLRGAVDPLPASWRQLAEVLKLLAVQTQKSLPDVEVTSVLESAAEQAGKFADMAERQLRGEPLLAQEYLQIQRYSGEIEHPYIKLKSVLAKHDEGASYGLSRPDPMYKIVDVAKGNGQIFHLAVGSPLAIAALIGDRGILVPAHGAVYSYYEVSSPELRDDAWWQKEPRSTWRPRWAPVPSGEMRDAW